MYSVLHPLIYKEGLADRKGIKIQEEGSSTTTSSERLEIYNGCTRTSKFSPTLEGFVSGGGWLGRCVDV